jgi:hypothetical protein
MPDSYDSFSSPTTDAYAGIATPTQARPNSDDSSFHPLHDMAEGFKEPFRQVGRNFAESKRISDARLKAPLPNPIQAIAEMPGDIARGNRDWASLLTSVPSAVIGAVTNPIAGAATAAGVRGNTSPSLSVKGELFDLNPNHPLRFYIEPSRPLNRQESQGQLNAMLQTSLGGLEAPGAKVAAPRFPTTASGVSQADAAAAARYVVQNAGRRPAAQVASGRAPQTLAEALGKPSQRALASLAVKEGDTADALGGLLSSRAAERPARIMEHFEAATGLSPETVGGNIDAVVAAGRARANPLFEEVRGYKDPIWNENLASIAKRPVVRRAISDAIADVENAGGDPTALRQIENGIVRHEAGGPVVETTGAPAPTAETWDKVYQAIQRQVERDPITKRTLPDSLSPGNVNVNVARRDLRKSLGMAVPKWDEAMTAAGEYKSIEGAFDAGKNLLFNPRVSVSDFTTRLARMPEPEQHALRAGIAHDIFNQAQNGRLTPGLLKTPALAGKAKAAFGEAGADALISALGSERDMAAFERRYGARIGTQASEADALAEKELHPAAHLAVQFGTDLVRYKHAGPSITAGRQIGKILSGMKTAGMSQGAQDEAGRILTMSPADYPTWRNSVDNAMIPRARRGPSVVANALVSARQPNP